MHFIMTFDKTYAKSLKNALQGNLRGGRGALNL